MLVSVVQPAATTPAGIAWEAVNGRAEIIHKYTLGEIDALLDFNLERADECRRLRDVVANALDEPLTAYERGLARIYGE